MAWTTPRTWIASEVVTAPTMNTHVRDNLDALSTWTAFTPTLTGWTLGNGTLTGVAIQAGDWVYGRINFRFGSTSATSGSLRISTPVTAAASAAGDASIGTAGLLDSSAAVRYFRHVFLTTTTELQFTSEADARVNATVPFTWAVDDKLVAHFAYEAA